MKFRIFFYGVLFVVPVVVFSADSFGRSLKMGMRGEDVRALQVVLNSDAETHIAATGAGSPGRETDYFGPATKRALIKFQEKYRAEVLTPAGLTAGTGFFGEMTRAKARSLAEGVPVTKNNTTPKSAPMATVTVKPDSAKVEVQEVLKGDVFVYFPSRYSGVPGTEVGISGEGFTATGNNVYFGANAIENVSSRGGSTLSVKVPNISKGVYSLSVKNARGESKGDAFFVVTDGVTPAPKVEGVSPSVAQRGSTITITGSGFTVKGNMVRTTLNIIDGVPSVDGKSLSFVVPKDILTTTDLSVFPTSSNVLPNNFSPSSKKVLLPVWIVVVNENGVSSGKSFNLEL